MTPPLSEADEHCLRRFFAPPNGLGWDEIEAGSATPRLLDRVRPWLARIASQDEGVLLLPFVRGGEITGWYAVARSAHARQDLQAGLKAWFASVDLRVFEAVPATAADAMAAALGDRFGGEIYRFGGADRTANAAIAERAAMFESVLRRQPARARRTPRPIGAIRAAFETALLASDEGAAEALALELRQTGRLNEENLRYLDVRLKAGLGFWPQIARDHWLITTLSDLALPPQVLADLVEALYRTYVEDLVAAGDHAATLEAFGRHIAGRYPRLFASRRGVRSARVVKSFLLFEALQPRPNPNILESLTALLPEAERAGPWSAAASAGDTAEAPDAGADAEAAFDDGQFDRALELFLAAPVSKRSAGRIILSAVAIGVAEAAARAVAAIEGAGPAVLSDLSANLRAKFDALKVQSEPAPALRRPTGWLEWAEHLAAGGDLMAAAAAIRDDWTTWDVRSVLTDLEGAQRFADLLGNLLGEAAATARLAFPQIYAALVTDQAEGNAGSKPVASTLFLLLAMDESLSAADLSLLAQLTSRLLALGLSEAEYISLARDLEEVQRRVGSYNHLPWSLDVSEAFAVAASPTEAARSSRLTFFMGALAQAQAVSRRLQPPDLMLLELLARDYGLRAEDLAALRPARAPEDAGTGPDLAGKTIGIYTLAEAAGARAKQILEASFPGCRVELNSDLVCTARLSSLAKAADLFVFAWKSSSHQAFYCVKEAMETAEPVWAAGKGTASILRAVYDALA